MPGLRSFLVAFGQHTFRLCAICVGIHVLFVSPCPIHADDTDASLTQMEIANLVENPVQPVFEKLRNGRVYRVSPTWRDQSHNADQRGITPSVPWTGTAGYGSPIRIRDGVFAIIEKKTGVAFSLWHLNTKDLGLRHIRAINQTGDVGSAASGFHKVTWYADGDSFKGEFTRLMISKNPKNTSKWDGQILVGLLNINTGDIEPGLAHKLTFISSAEKTQQLLLEKHTVKSDPLIPDTAAAKADINDALTRRGVAFNFGTGRVHLAADTVAQLVAAADAVDCSQPDFKEKIRAAVALTTKYPTCEAIRDLTAQLKICEATSERDLGVLSKYAYDENQLVGVASERRHRLRTLAGYQILHIIATTTDDIRDYVQVAEKSMDLREIQDAAILRSHELLFLRACRKGTVDAFDAFIKSAPIALQISLAKEFASRLAAEDIDAQIKSAKDEDKAREAVARGLYTDWRKAFRSQDLLKADRCFQLLSEHNELKTTVAAVQAQDTQDRLDFEAAMKTQGSQQMEIMKSIAMSQQTQLEMMGDQLAQQRQMSSTLGVIEQQLGYVSYDLKSIGSSAEKSERSLELIRNLLD